MLNITNNQWTILGSADKVLSTQHKGIQWLCQDIIRQLKHCCFHDYSQLQTPKHKQHFQSHSMSISFALHVLRVLQCLYILCAVGYGIYVACVRQQIVPTETPLTTPVNTGCFDNRMVCSCICYGFVFDTNFFQKSVVLLSNRETKHGCVKECIVNCH